MRGVAPGQASERYDWKRAVPPAPAPCTPTVPVDSPSALAALRAAKMAKMGPSVVVTRALTQVVEGLNVHLELLLTSNVTKAGNMREAVVHTHEPDVGEEHEVISIAFADTKARYPWSR